MNDDYTFYKSRRRFMKGTGSMMALGSMPAYLTANPEKLKESLEELSNRMGVVLYREDELHSVAFADMLVKAGMEAVALTDDPVRLWRDSLGDMVGKAGVSILGLTSWPEYLIINGLAAEQRKHVMLELQHAVDQPDKLNWSANLAVEYLHLPVTSNKQTIQSHFKRAVNESAVKPGTQSLFSWLIS